MVAVTPQQLPRQDTQCSSFTWRRRLGQQATGELKGQSCFVAKCHCLQSDHCYRLGLPLKTASFRAFGDFLSWGQRKGSLSQQTDSFAVRFLAPKCLPWKQSVHMALGSLGNAIWHRDPATVAPARISEGQGCRKVASANGGGKKQEGDGSEWLKAGLEGVLCFTDEGQLLPPNSSSHLY